MLKCPIEIREWLQTVSLSLPIGCKIFIAGGYPLSEYVGSWETKNIDVFMLGYDIIKDKIQTIHSEDDLEPFTEIMFYGKQFQAGSYGYLYDWDIWRINLYVTNGELISDIVNEFDMNICECIISDLEVVDWEIVVASHILDSLESKIVKCKSSDVLFPHTYHSDLMNRVRKYKTRLPGFKFVMEL